MSDVWSFPVTLKPELFGKELLSRVVMRDGQQIVEFLAEDPKAEGRALRSGIEAILRRYDSRSDLRAALRRLLDEKTP